MPGFQQPSRLRAALPSFVLAVASIMFVPILWLLTETAIRVFDARYLDRFGLDDLSYLHVYSEQYGWVPRAGFHLRLGRGPETTINAAGYRGTLYPLDRTPGKVRLLMLGDSLAFGYGVADEDTSSRQLEQIEPSLEVVNLAVQGYGTDQEFLRFEREGLLFHPDVVILNFCLANDFRDNAATRAIYDGAFPKPYFTMNEGTLTLHEENVRLSLASRIALFLHQRSIVFNQLQRMARRPPARPADEIAIEHTPDRALTVALLRQFGATARANDLRLIILIYPTLREFIKPSRRPGVILTAPGLQDVTRVDLRPLLESRGINAQTYSEYALDGSFHATARGHRVVAETIADLLHQMGVLPARASASAQHIGPSLDILHRAHRGASVMRPKDVAALRTAARRANVAAGPQPPD